MAIIRDENGNVYNIPEVDLKKYLVVKTGSTRPETLCLEPIFDAVRGPHDGWAYMDPLSKPAKKSATQVATKLASTVASKVAAKVAKKAASKAAPKHKG